MKRAFIIHGYVGVPDDAWKPWLKHGLEEQGFNVASPAMPDPDQPKLSEWVRTVQEAVGRPDPDCYFVGHSLGCATILRYLESLPDGERVGGCVFVAAFASSGRPELQTFFESPLDWSKVRAACNKYVAVYSDNDVWVSVGNAATFERELGSKIVVEQFKGHFGADDGITELPVALDSILEFAAE